MATMNLRPGVPCMIIAMIATMGCDSGQAPAVAAAPPGSSLHVECVYPSGRVSSVRVMAVSPGGGAFAWGDDNGNVHIASVSGRGTARVYTEENQAEAMAMTCSDDNALYWMSFNGIRRATIRGTRVVKVDLIAPEAGGETTAGAITGDAFFRNASAGLLSRDYHLEKWSLASVELVARTVPYPRAGARTHYAESMALSRCGGFLAVCSNSDAAVLSVSDLGVVSTLGVGLCKSIALSDDGSRVAVSVKPGGPDSPPGISVHDSATGDRLLWLRNDDWDGPLAFRDNDHLWITSRGEVHLVEVATGEIRVQTKLPGWPTALAYRDGRLFVGTSGGVVVYVEPLTK